MSIVVRYIGYLLGIKDHYNPCTNIETAKVAPLPSCFTLAWSSNSNQFQFVLPTGPIGISVDASCLPRLRIVFSIAFSIASYLTVYLYFVALSFTLASHSCSYKCKTPSHRRNSWPTCSKLHLQRWCLSKAGVWLDGIVRIICDLQCDSVSDTLIGIKSEMRMGLKVNSSSGLFLRNLLGTEWSNRLKLPSFEVMSRTFCNSPIAGTGVLALDPFARSYDVSLDLWLHKVVWLAGMCYTYTSPSTNDTRYWCENDPTDYWRHTSYLAHILASVYFCVYAGSQVQTYKHSRRRIVYMYQTLATFIE